MARSSDGVTVVVPTFGREGVLVDTLSAVLALDPPPDEIIVVDQTPEHEAKTTARMSAWHDEGAIRWLRQAEPSIPQAMNRGLLAARHPIVLYLDDDIVPTPRLIGSHRDAYEDAGVWAVVGQVLQPGQVPIDAVARHSGRALRRDLSWPFNATHRRDVANCIACNLSVRRDRAIEVGGFDENFVRVAYRFETEFARRLIGAGGRLAFEPGAGIRHLRAPRGGTRAYADLRRSPQPDHSVGDYYFALRHGRGLDKHAYVVRRMLRSLRSRYLAWHPWWLPAKLLGEVRGLAWAMRLSAAGPRLLEQSDAATPQSADTTSTECDPGLTLAGADNGESTSRR